MNLESDYNDFEKQNRKALGMHSNIVYVIPQNN